MWASAPARKVDGQSHNCVIDAIVHDDQPCPCELQTGRKANLDFLWRMSIQRHCSACQYFSIHVLSRAVAG
jgi:hypothetical protein